MPESVLSRQMRTKPPVHSRTSIGPNPVPSWWSSFRLAAALLRSKGSLEGPVGV
jgi:hypothetical protein